MYVILLGIIVETLKLRNAFVDIQEIYGSHYELPELGPLGANGLANPRDFEHPVASFDIDQSPWEIVYKYEGASSALLFFLTISSKGLWTVTCM